ncbi:N-acyl-D-amino-acid deacylase family protein [Microtetraspora malaysiensis]|uniref:N-acyl-D-amino-acid deacylase family protein n=1 Tax=Microtetraspora malaysiensis TaxID=161358 RepID=UPI003D94F343
MHDLLLRHGTVHDGFGGPAREADVAIDDGRVTAVGRDLGAARRVIDVSGLVVAPGFVDPHSHSDTVPFLAEPQPFKLYQGVTTEIIGNCGFSCGPANPDTAGFMPAVLAGEAFTTFGAYLDAAQAAGPSNNLAVLVGHNTLRLAAGGMEAAPGPKALDRMCALAAESFTAGAAGLSSGLEYVPGAYADTAELVALALVARRWNLPYATHMRNESEGLADALDEAIAVATRAGVRLQVSHCKASGRAVHGSSAMLLAKLAAARRAGLDVRADVYPYRAFGTGLVAVLPRAPARAARTRCGPGSPTRPSGPRSARWRRTRRPPSGSASGASCTRPTCRSSPTPTPPSPASGWPTCPATRGTPCATCCAPTRTRTGSSTPCTTTT